jgi:hypothetical protein
VIEGGPSPTGGPGTERSGPAPWYDKLWRSVQQADSGPAK